MYAAVDTAMSRPVALKVMQPHGKASVNVVAVKREVRTHFNAFYLLSIAPVPDSCPGRINMIQPLRQRLWH